MVGLDKTIIEFQNKRIYILEFHCRKDKIKLLLIYVVSIFNLYCFQQSFQIVEDVKEVNYHLH